MSAIRRALPLLVMLLSLYTVASDLRASIRIHLVRRRPDEVTRMERPLAAARRWLPASGTVGYVGPQEALPFDRARRYYLTQYALAPLVVARSEERDLVVGNFVDVPPGTAVEVPHDLILFRDLGGGVLVFKRRKR